MVRNATIILYWTQRSVQYNYNAKSTLSFHSFEIHLFSTMAAPPSKPSPSNKEVQQTTDEATSLATAKAVVNETPVVDYTATEEEKQESFEPTITIPSYEISESSEHYVLAKLLLDEGDFEQALASIEQGIETCKALLMSIGVEPDLHECMAPFHYLYGTTLLYSIEESTDTQLTTTVGDTNTASGPEEEEEASVPAAAASAAQEEQDSPPPPAENADDMEIAWENLEAARNILEGMLTSDNKISQEFKSKLQLDLAQMLLREGDLQRMNGRYVEAIQDYESCLQLFSLLLEPFSRKIADAHYNLGLSYLSHSGELQKEETSETNNNNTNTTSSDYANRQKLSHEMCRKGMDCYVACAKTLCGQLALLCGVEASSVLATSTGTQGTQGKAGFKTTGLDNDDARPVSSSSSEASQTLSVWRRNVADLSPLEAGAGAGDPNTVEDLRQLLDEIQETVDEAERSQDAVRQASQMKVQAQNAITKSDEAELSSGSGGTTATAMINNPWANITTTIGFDKPTMEAKPAAAAAVGQTPMMVVKKKKKRDVTTTEGEDAKPSADAKRAKTE
jgi:tetratricopeptide (TPR) repeat protein